MSIRSFLGLGFESKAKSCVIIISRNILIPSGKTKLFFLMFQSSDSRGVVSGPPASVSPLAKHAGPQVTPQATQIGHSGPDPALWILRSPRGTSQQATFENHCSQATGFYRKGTEPCSYATRKIQATASNKSCKVQFSKDAKAINRQEGYDYMAQTWGSGSSLSMLSQGETLTHSILHQL